VQTRNITFNLPTEIIRQAKIYAAEHDTTINALVRELLQDMVGGESRARSAAGRLLALADRGPYFTGDPGAIRREDLHEHPCRLRRSMGALPPIERE
jgi:plasmid stability protein